MWINSKLGLQPLDLAQVLKRARRYGFVDVLARRIASFDWRPITAAKNLITKVSLPTADRLLYALTGGPRCSARSSRRSHRVANRHRG